jgi:hypothetical protein
MDTAWGLSDLPADVQQGETGEIRGEMVVVSNLAASLERMIQGVEGEIGATGVVHGPLSW